MSWMFADFETQDVCMTGYQPREWDDSAQFQDESTLDVEVTRMEGEVVFDLCAATGGIDTLQDVLGLVCFARAHVELGDLYDIVGANVVRRARQSLSHVIELFALSPGIAPLPDKTAVAFEWVSDGRELLYEIGESDAIPTLLVEGDVDLLEADFHDMQDLRKLARWLKTGASLQTLETNLPAPLTTMNN